MKMMMRKSRRIRLIRVRRRMVMRMIRIRRMMVKGRRIKMIRMRRVMVMMIIIMKKRCSTTARCRITC